MSEHNTMLYCCPCTSARAHKCHVDSALVGTEYTKQENKRVITPSQRNSTAQAWHLRGKATSTKTSLNSINKESLQPTGAEEIPLHKPDVCEGKDA